MTYVWKEENFKQVGKLIRQDALEIAKNNGWVSADREVLPSKAHNLIKEVSDALMGYNDKKKTKSEMLVLLAKAFVYLESFAAVFVKDLDDQKDENKGKYVCTLNFLKIQLINGDFDEETFFFVVEQEAEELVQNGGKIVEAVADDETVSVERNSADDMLSCLEELDEKIATAEKEFEVMQAKKKSWDLRFLSLAKLVASWSKDPSSKVGAVIVDKKNRVVSLGFNGLPMGVEDTEERLNNRELKYDLIVHAEQNAILCSPQSVSDCRIYVYPYLPCSRCAGAIIQSGITEVVVEDLPIPDRWVKNFNLAKEILQEAGVNVRQIKGKENG